MKPRQPIRDPDYRHEFIRHARDEAFSQFAFLRLFWPWVLLFLLGIGLAIYVVRPIPPSHVVLATGQRGLAYDAIGERYRRFFDKHGVELTLVNTAGSLENIGLLANGKVDAALSQGGVTVPPESGILSLGSIQFEPLWLFYRGPYDHADDPRALLENLRISIGAEGSGTRKMVTDFLEVYQPEVGPRPNLLTMNAADSVDALRRGDIDAVFLVAGTASPEVMSLLKDPGIRLWDFRIAKAAERKINYVRALTLPVGAITMTPVNPSKELNLLATTTSILVHDDLHPALQHLFMLAAEDFYRNTHFYFDRDGGFPAVLSKTVPVADVAKKFIAEGRTQFDSAFPWWLASFLDRAWLLLLAAWAIIYPLSRLWPNYRNFHFNAVMDGMYGQIREADVDLHEAKSPEEYRAVKDRIDRLEKEIVDVWVPAGAKERYYLLINAYALLRSRAERTEPGFAASNAVDGPDAG